MNHNLYEIVSYPDYYFPLIYHFHKLNKKGSVFNTHWHESFEILYFIEGKAYVKCDDSNFYVESGDIIVVNSNQLHTIDPCPSCTYHCFLISEVMFEYNNIPLSDSSFVNLIPKDKELCEILDNTAYECTAKPEKYKMASMGHIQQFLAILFRRYAKREMMIESKKEMLESVKKSILFMEENFSRNLTLEKISQSANMSKYYFCRVFKETVGKSPIEYFNVMRVNRAAFMLKEGSLNVFQTAEACGYKSYSYFSKVFKKYMKASPSEFKPGKFKG